jgi:30S ribosomal protein S31
VLTCLKIYFFVNYDLNIKSIIMGKGDKKTKRGKINRGTFGARRPRIKKKPSVEIKISIDKKAIAKP